MTTHSATVEWRHGVRVLARFYRWHCSCGQVGRWTRQPETAQTGAERHGRKP